LYQDRLDLIGFFQRVYTLDECFEFYKELADSFYIDSSRNYFDRVIAPNINRSQLKVDLLKDMEQILEKEG